MGKIYFISILFSIFSILGCQKSERVETVTGALSPNSPAPIAASEKAPAPKNAERNEPSSPSAPPAHPPRTAPPATPPHTAPAAAPFMQRLAEYKERLEKNPKDIEAMIFLANANFDIQRFEKAKEFYLRALEVDPHNNYVRTDLASSYRNLGDTDTALQELNKVLKSDPNHEVALYNLGVILLNDKEDRQKAAAAWERLVQIKPNDPLAAELKEKIKELRAPVAKKSEKTRTP